MKGASGEKEARDAEKAIKQLGGQLIAEHKLSLIDANGNREERYLVIVKKIAHTPNNFPRQYAQILKKPL